MTRVGDQQKRRRGTYRPSRSEKVRPPPRMGPPYMLFREDRTAKLIDDLVDTLRWGDGAENHRRCDLRVSWEYAKGVLLPEFVQHLPRTRPWAWWEFDASPEMKEARAAGEPEAAILTRFKLLVPNETVRAPGRSRRIRRR